MHFLNKIFSTLFLLALLLTGTAYADDNAKHKLVIQVNSNDAATQKIALNNAVNVQKSFGIDNVDIEIVAYGPGLGLLTSTSSQKERVSSLAMQKISFSACGNTIKKVTKKAGKAPVLISGVNVVPAGVIRIMELQEQGYSYIKP